MDATPNPRPDLLQEHVDGVRRLARHLVRDPDDAEDVAQESLLAAVDRGPGEVRDVGAWLRGVVRNKARLFGRTAGRRAYHEGRATAPGVAAAASDVVARLEVQQRLVEAVQALPESYRTVLWLRYFEDLSAREIAEQLTLPVETIRTRVKRGRERLRVEMDERHGGKRAPWVAALVPFLPEAGAVASAVATPAAVAAPVLIGVLALAGVLVVGLVVVLRSKTANSPTEGERAGIERALDVQEDPDSAPVELGGHGRPAPVADVPTSPPADERGVFFHGRVRSRGGKPIPQALVSIVEGPGLEAPGGESRPWRVLGRAKTDADGRCRVELRPGGRAPGHLTDPLRVTDALPVLVLVVAEARGFRPSRQRVRLEGLRTTFELELLPGATLHGQVLDEAGRPVVDLPVCVWSTHYVPSMVSTTMFWSDRKRLDTQDGDYVEARAQTDAGGRFVAEGLEPGRDYAVFSRDLAWFLKQEALVRLLADEDPARVSLLAVRGRALVGMVVDAGARAPLARGHVELMLHTPGGDSMGSNAAIRDGRFLAAWDLDEDLSGALEVTAKAEAKGYKTATVKRTLAAGEAVLELGLALEPILEGNGTVLLTITEPRGAPLAGDVLLWVRGRDDARVQLRRRPERVREGVFRFDLPAGSYQGTLQPAHVLGSYSAAAFEVHVVEGAVTPLRVETGGGATLRLRLPLVAEVPSSMLSIRAVGEREHKVAGGSTDLSQVEDQILRGETLVWTGFLPGTWKLELHWDGEILERTVTLAEGDDHLVSFR